MYEGGEDAGAGAPALGGSGKRINLEGIIPLILLVIIGIASLNYFGVVDVPYLPKGSARVNVLFIGEPSLGERAGLDRLSYFVTWRQREASTFGMASIETFNQYDIVILDQSNIADKSITVSLGEALQKYVQKGGKLIVVMNSGVYQSAGFGGYTSNDVTNWKATLGDIVPANCIASSDGVPSCAEGKEVTVVGRIWAEDYEHPIMQGIETAPPIGQAPVVVRTLEIAPTPTAKRVAFIQGESISKTYDAILEQKSFPMMGTVIYFNYDPGMTPGIFNNTIFYLK